MRDLPERFMFTAALFKELWSPMGVAVVGEVARNLCHGAADRVDRGSDLLRTTGDFFHHLGTLILSMPNPEVEGRTSSGRPRSARQRGSRKPFGPNDIGVSASGRRSVASSERSCMEGRPTDVFKPLQTYSVELAGSMNIWEIQALRSSLKVVGVRPGPKLEHSVRCAVCTSRGRLYMVDINLTPPDGHVYVLATVGEMPVVLCDACAATPDRVFSEAWRTWVASYTRSTGSA